MTLYDYIHAHLSHFQQIFKEANAYKKTYRNFFQIILKRRKKQFPIKATLKNGKKALLNNSYQTKMYTWGVESYCSFKDDILILKKHPWSEIKFVGWEENGDIDAIFFKKDYDSLPVKGKTVIDIGANIGDSSIYFAINGVNKVIALEPIPLNYQFAEKNIILNNLSNKIELIKAGCSNKNGHIQINSKESGYGVSLENSDEGDIKIPLLTLQEIISRCESDELVLKIDCEGCEYEIINSSSPEILQKFSHIIIEYHFGYANLKQKLENSGFSVTVTNPKIGKKITSQKNRIYFGYLFAEKTINC